jgi:hypothetical protein
VFSYKLSENTEVRLLEERHAQRLTDLTDRNREHLREWLPWVDTNNDHACTTTGTVRFGTQRTQDLFGVGKNAAKQPIYRTCQYAT